MLYVGNDGSDKGLCDDPANACATLSYALRVAGKGSEIRVAAGTYQVASAEDLFHIVSGVINVRGGYSPDDRFRAPTDDPSILTGVPHEYREQLHTRGFGIVADRKAIGAETIDATNKMLALRTQLASFMPAATCNGGLAGGLPCDQVDLLSHLAFAGISARPSAANDVWGFVDLNSQREYAIVGYNFGTAVIDVTDPETPREVGFVDGQTASWRDVKVYQFFDDALSRWRAYAYVTTDGSTDGIFVIDLAGLPHSIRRSGFSSDIQRAHNVYISNTDFSTGIVQTARSPMLIVAGSEVESGRFRAYSLTDPATPAFIGGPSTPDYMHDAASIVITDSRKDTQCQASGPVCEVLLDFNESTIEIWDITDSPPFARLSSSTYTSPRYVHSGWWSEDRQFMFVHDELDETQRSLATTIRIFSLADLRNPVQVGTWSGPTGAIDHNGFVRGNRYYMSNYSRGLAVLDITSPASPVQLGFLDTSPSPDQAVFAGAWGAYPFFPSGTIAVSDMQSGLYLLSDQTRNVAQGSMQFSSPSAAMFEGQPAVLNVDRVAGSSGTITAGYELLPATADATDYQSVSGVVSWADGDTTSRQIQIPLVNDGNPEQLEQFIVRLVNPTGGGTLGNANTAFVYVSDPGAAPGVAFLDPTIDISERGFATAVVVVKRTGVATGAASIDFSVTGGDAQPALDYAGDNAGTLSWDAGDGRPKFIEYTIVDDGVAESTEFFEITLSNPAGAVVDGQQTLRVNIEDGSGLNQPPNAIAGSSQTVNENSLVRLDGSQSADADGDNLAYEWQQVSGPAVSLSGASSALSQFTAPDVDSDTMMQFRLTVTDPGGLTDMSTATVVVVQFGGGNGGGVAVAAARWM